MLMQDGLTLIDLMINSKILEVFRNPLQGLQTLKELQ